MTTKPEISPEQRGKGDPKTSKKGCEENGEGDESSILNKKSSQKTSDDQQLNKKNEGNQEEGESQSLDETEERDELTPL